jgi:hypothetical protein
VRCWRGSLLLCHGLGQHDPSCAAWRRRTYDRFCVREPGRVAATCGGSGSVPGELGRCWPPVTVVVRCDPVVRGPNVAPAWPHGSRAWKARPGNPSGWDASPMALLSASLDRPLLSVGDRQGPVLRARGGHGRRGRRWLQPGSNGHQLDWRVRPIPGDHCLVGKRPKAVRQPLGAAG